MMILGKEPSPSVNRVTFHAALLEQDGQTDTDR